MTYMARMTNVFIKLNYLLLVLVFSVTNNNNKKDNYFKLWPWVQIKKNLLLINLHLFWPEWPEWPGWKPVAAPDRHCKITISPTFSRAELAP